MTRLLLYWHKFWGDFEGEFSISFKREKVTAMLSTTPARFIFYALLFAGVYWGLSQCDSVGEILPGAYQMP